MELHRFCRNKTMTALEKDKNTEQQGFQSFQSAFALLVCVQARFHAEESSIRQFTLGVPSSTGGLSVEVMLSLGLVSCEDSIRLTKIQATEAEFFFEILSPIVVCSSSKTMDLQ